MPNPSRELQHRNLAAEELQVQRERLRQALVNGGSLEDAVDLMRAMRVLLPKTVRKQTQPRVAGKFAATPK
jgi:hypothetical protein